MAVPGTPNKPLSTRETESRVSERYTRRISVAYSFHPSALPTQKPTPFRFGTLLNVSTEGLCIRSADPFCVSQILSLYLKLTDQSNGIKTLGKVVWAEVEGEGTVRAGIRLIGTLPSDWRRFISVA